LQPFKILGCKLKFFRCDPNTFSVDIEDLRKKINQNTKLIHIINHFGMPQPWEEILSIRHKSGIPILEDNAYSLFSRIGDRFFGTFGDFSVFSLRKNLPLIDGGLLRINNPEYLKDIQQKDVRWCYPAEYLNILSIVSRKLKLGAIGRFLRSWGKKCFPLTEPPPALYSDVKRGIPEWRLRDFIGRDFLCDYLRPMSQFSRMQLAKFSEDDYEDICKKRRQFYTRLVDKLGQIKGIDILWPNIPVGIVPFCLSVLVESERDSFLEALRKKYDVMVWPTLPGLVLNELENYPEVEFLGRKLLQLNLPSHKVRLPGFQKCLDELVKDIYLLTCKR